MNELALFAGAGGGILGGRLLGWRTVCAVEINSFCARRLMQRQNEGHLPPFPIWNDVCTFNGAEWKGHIDVVSGGFPCQPFSTATHGRKTATDLWPEMRRIVQEVRPKFIFAENVSHKAVVAAERDSRELGYRATTISLSAKDLGADHVRKRYWLLAHSDLCNEFLSQINAETQKLSRICHSVWETDPNKSRVDDGLAHRVDRLRAIGNGQVPIVAATAWDLLSARLGTNALINP